MAEQPADLFGDEDLMWWKLNLVTLGMSSEEADEFIKVSRGPANDLAKSLNISLAQAAERVYEMARGH